MKYSSFCYRYFYISINALEFYRANNLFNLPEIVLVLKLKHSSYQEPFHLGQTGTTGYPSHLEKL